MGLSERAHVAETDLGLPRCQANASFAQWRAVCLHKEAEVQQETRLKNLKSFIFPLKSFVPATKAQ